MRVLTKTLAVVSLLAPASGHALGIGEIRLQSALNQNLYAEISLTLSGETASDIKVKLAPSEKFDQAGVSWTYFLSKIKFETIMLANGSAAIKLTSNEVLKEPFLDFLLEVSWPKGVLYREFTVLVDPPADYKQASIPVSSSTQSYAQSPVSTPQSPTGQYGPTLASDTLWSVAERALGQDNISVEQMMIAIYQANPQAFYKGNVHSLTAGKMLTIPDRETVLKLSRNQALAEFNRQTKAWKSHQAPAHVETAKEKPVPSKAEAPVDNQLRLIPPAKESVEGHAAPAKEQKTPEIAPGTDSSMQNKVVELEKQLTMMQQMIVLKDQQLADLQSQLNAKPEHPVPGTVQTLPVQPAPVIPKPAEPVLPKAVGVPVQPVAKPETDDFYYQSVAGAGSIILMLLGWLWWRKRKVDEQTNTESMFASSSLIKAPDTLTKSLSKSDETDSVAEFEEGAAVVHDAGTVGESSFLSEFTPSDFDSFDTDQGEIDPLSEADVYLAYGRYQQAEELIRQAIKDQPNRDECKLKLLEIFYANEDNAAFEAYAAELVKAGKQNEAEFWGKAAEMGREICADSPLFSSGRGVAIVEQQSNNQDIDFDLSSFSIDPMDSEEADNGVIAPSTKVAKSIEQIEFGVNSFSIESDNGVIATSTETGKSSKIQADDLDFDLSLFSMDSDESDQGVIATSTETGKSSKIQADDLDFDLSLFSMDSDESDQGVIAASTETGQLSRIQANDLDFDLSSFSMDSDESDQGVIAASTETGQSSRIQANDLDFDFDLSSFSMNSNVSKEVEEFKTSSALSDSSTGTTDSKELEFESYEFNFSSDTTGIDNLDFSEPEVGTKNHQDVDFSAGLLDINDDLDSDFDFNFDLPITSSGQHGEFGVSDLTDMDELETKLDLAKAYVDMGDADAAKDLAKEVLEQGTVEQKKTAQLLLDELD